MIYLSNKSKTTDTVFTDWTKILPQIRRLKSKKGSNIRKTGEKIVNRISLKVIQLLLDMRIE